MKPFQLLPFFVALAVEIGLCASLNFFDDWTLEQMPVRFVAAAIAAGIAYLVAVGQFPLSLSYRKQALLLWGIAIVLRLVVLPLAPGDDVARYQWEGKVQLAGYNPYSHLPNDSALESLRKDFQGWQKINRRDYSLTYPPAAELLFAAVSHITDNPLFYKLLFAAADLGIIAILLRVIPKESACAYASWYAWNPLVVYSFAGSGHLDSLMLLALFAAILCLVKFEETDSSRGKWICSLATATFLGLAIAIRPIPILLLPLCIAALGYRAVTLLVSLVIPSALSVIYGFPRIPVWHSLTQFVQGIRLNDLFWWVTEETVWPNPHQQHYRYDVVIVVVVVVLSILFYRNWRRGVLWVMGTVVVLSPVLHPWYCTWVLPFAAWRRVDPWHVLAVTLFAYFLFWNERLFLLPWHSELWLRAIIIVPPLIATLFFLSREDSPESGSS
ncbi:MAG: hypothetical protein ACXWFY_00155 [Chthoniobacterales bacterium]